MDLRLRTVNSLLGESFFIPSYQRGYRWTDRNVRDLLNDIWSFAKSDSGKFYCLQPLVVQNQTVIDGQQRLTTIYIILKYLLKEYLKTDSLSDDYGRDLFSISYKTRIGSEEFLSSIDSFSNKAPCKENIDFYYMSKAYNVVREWFVDTANIKDRSDRELFLRTLLGKEEDARSVQVIWYEADATEDGVALFTRLNVGKIPLTNAELIKALFLSSSAFSGDSGADIKKKEISLIWDKIESELSNADFWAFASNAPQKDSNRIELIFDAYLEKTTLPSDPLFTFIEFNRKLDAQRNLWETWLDIERFYETLLYWYKDKQLYHKDKQLYHHVGFLVCCGYKLYELLHKAKEMRHDEFNTYIDQKICEQVKLPEDVSNIGELNYQKHPYLIQKILLLFNIESILRNPDQNEFYPFRLHKDKNWSLEHIHAQNSDELRTEKEWGAWLIYHKPSVKRIADDPTESRNKQAQELLHKLQAIMEKSPLKKEAFDDAAIGITDLLTAQSDAESMHSIGNLALLSKDDNSALNNAVYAVKRKRIIELDKLGYYIPVCTRRVFFKYYSPEESEINAQYFWSDNDKKYYKNEIAHIIKKYLEQREEI